MRSGHHERSCLCCTNKHELLLKPTRGPRALTALRCSKHSTGQGHAGSKDNGNHDPVDNHTTKVGSWLIGRASGSSTRLRLCRPSDVCAAWLVCHLQALPVCQLGHCWFPASSHERLINALSVQRLHCRSTLLTAGPCDNINHGALSACCFTAALRPLCC